MNTGGSNPYCKDYILGMSCKFSRIYPDSIRCRGTPCNYEIEEDIAGRLSSLFKIKAKLIKLVEYHFGHFKRWKVLPQYYYVDPSSTHNNGIFPPAKYVAEEILEIIIGKR